MEGAGVYTNWRHQGETREEGLGAHLVVKGDDGQFVIRPQLLHHELQCFLQQWKMLLHTGTAEEGQTLMTQPHTLQTPLLSLLFTVLLSTTHSLLPNPSASLHSLSPLLHLLSMTAQIVTGALFSWSCCARALTFAMSVTSVRAAETFRYSLSSSGTREEGCSCSGSRGS